MQANNKIISGLTLIALVAMIAAYFSPIWWVSLTAPNYPPDAFPDGIRIHFHFDGVYNGCKAAGKGTRMANEIIQKDLSHEDERWNPVLDPKKQKLDMKAEGLDCVHEMNTINHYVGMFPIATGAPVEKPLAKFFFGFFAVMLATFACVRPKVRLAILTVGFAAVAGWAIIDQYLMGHLATHVKDYMAETATFFNEPEKIKVWGENVTLITNIVIGSLMASGKFAASSCCWLSCRRCYPSSSSSSMPPGCGSSGTTCILGAPSRSSLSCPPCSARARSRSFRPTPIPTGATRCC
jgi:hypothetical protein